ncbi:MAG: hypothetical protein ACE149_03445 [Armatimonadota bacterium]
MGDQTAMPHDVREQLVNDMIGKEIRANGSVFRVLRVLPPGSTAVTFEVEDAYGVRWALKLVTKESYGERAPLREVGRLVRAGDPRFLAFPLEVGDWEFKGTPFVWFKARCVNGLSLEQFLMSDTAFDAREEIDLFLSCVTAALSELSKLGYAHGDLHGRNIIREEIGKGGPRPAVSYVVIDFSESHEIGAPADALRADLESLGQHLRAFADALHRRVPLTREDEMALSAIGHLPGLLAGGPAEAAPPMAPNEVLERFREGIVSATQSRVDLKDPFDCLSAEDIASDALLAKLCFTAHWWVSDLEGSGNVLLIGPRGCGKTMLFRRIRLKTKAAASLVEEIRKDDYVAFYVPCESVFYLRFADMTEATIERYERQLVAFFNMAVLAEVSSALASVAGIVFELPPTLSQELLQLAVSEAGEDALPPRTAVSNLSDVSHIAKLALARIREGVARGVAVKSEGSIEFVSRIVEMVKREVPSLAGRKFIFLLDDYTDERVPIRLQRSLHPIVSQRSADSCFKLSAHMFGSIYSYPHQVAPDEGRNMLVVNIGHEYLNPARRKAERKCLIEILNKRILNSPTHEGTIDQWLGETAYPGGVSLARALHDRASRPRAYYHGIDCLVDLCSGDIAEMVRMVRAIFQRAQVAAPPEDGGRREPAKIPARVQHEAITAVSQELLGRVRHIPREGQKLFDILDAFGNLSRRYLWHHPLVGQGKGKSGGQRKDPYDLLTIYVDQLTRAQGFARRRWQLLQRAAIFIDIRTGRSQRETIADRATLRRVYCPAFRTCLSSSEHLQLTRKQFDYFMDRPHEYCGARGPGKAKQAEDRALFEDPDDLQGAAEDGVAQQSLPREKDRISFRDAADPCVKSFDAILPALSPIANAIPRSSTYDLYLGALGFEDRTTAGIEELVRLGTRVANVLLFEFDMNSEGNERHRDEYERLSLLLSQNRPHRPFNAPLASRDSEFMARLEARVRGLCPAAWPRVLFDCTSCPSLILSQALRVLTSVDCDLTILYSEAADYFPTREEWESGQIKPPGDLVKGPCYGFQFAPKPPGLQGDDLGEKPVALVIFPTFNTHRTDGVLAELDPAERIWAFGQPHDPVRNDYRYDMMVAMARPLMYPGDPWTVVPTFDYRAALQEFAGVYARYRPTHRLVVLPHGSKMQTLGVGLFALTHPVSFVFANPKTYNPLRYSAGCIGRWCIPLGRTRELRARLLEARVTPARGRRPQ